MVDGIWDEFLKIAREEAGSRVVETWFKAVILEQWDASTNTVHLRAPNAFVRDWIKNNYIPLIQLHVGRLLNVQQPTVIFLNGSSYAKASADVAGITPATKTTTMAAELVLVPVGRAYQKNSLVKAAPRRNFSHVNRAYLFDTFVVGPSNSLAYAAAHAVTEKPGQLYNPLFIYGSSGLGKTHLLHAIGNEIKANDKDACVLYQTADRFVNEFINAIRFDKIHKFQKKYKSVDVLLVDDIQFISNKEQTQEAFFHIFNLLYDAHKQIVFSSDVVPQDIKGIAERLRSRLACGLVADMYAPPLETKIAILKKKAELSGEMLDDAVAHFIASCVDSNIRELEGALIRVMAFASLTKQELSLDLAQKVLVRFGVQEQRQIDFSRVVKCLSKHYAYDLLALRSKNRNKELAFVRQVAMFLMRKLTEKSLRDIGVFLGGRDHSTVMHALDKMERYLENNPEFQVKLKRIEKEIKS